MRLLWFLSLLLVTMACGQRGQRFAVSEDPNAAEGSSQNQNGAIHSLVGWRQQVPFTVDAAFDAGQVKAIQNAVKTWNEAIGREVLHYAGVHQGNHGANLYTSLDDQDTVIYFEKSWNGTTGKQATTLATTVWESAANDADAIDRGDVIMNGEYYLFADTAVAVEPDDGRALADMESVILHELGHLLGLNHVPPEDDGESVMLAYTLIGENVYHRQLSEQDIEHIRSIYDK